MAGMVVVHLIRVVPNNMIHRHNRNDVADGERGARRIRHLSQQHTRAHERGEHHDRATSLTGDDCDGQYKKTSTELARAAGSSAVSSENFGATILWHKSQAQANSGALCNCVITPLTAAAVFSANANIPRHTERMIEGQVG